MVVAEIQVGARILVEKRLSPRERGEPEAALALASEARLLGAIGGRGAPLLVEAGEDARGPFVRMEKIASPILAARLTGPLDPAWVDRAFRVTLAALADIHELADERGPLAIVHADLSPSNVAIDDAASRATILDFGLATWRDGPPRDGAFRGTVAYVAPEIAKGEPPTQRSDLYALGATFLHALTGRPPRTGTSLATMIAAAAEEPIALPHHDAIARCLAHDPGERPPSARELLRSLRRDAPDAAC